MGNPFGGPGMAEGYARSRPPVHPRVIELVRAHRRLGDPLARALDVGCGAGLSTAPLCSIARHSLGIEPDREMLRWSAAVAPGARFAAGRAEALPVRSGSFDLLTAAGSLNYVRLDLFFPEAARVLRPRGLLVVYDFSPGRSFPGSDRLDRWFSRFESRYPWPQGQAREITPASLARFCPGFVPDGQEDFAVALPLDPRSYVDYVMTETCVADAVARGAEEAVVRAWCTQTLAEVFEGRPREVLFRGYVAYLIRA
jgi:SAM-dependent methyltransferase